MLQAAKRETGALLAAYGFEVASFSGHCGAFFQYRCRNSGPQSQNNGYSSIVLDSLPAAIAEADWDFIGSRRHSHTSAGTAVRCLQHSLHSKGRESGPWRKPLAGERSPRDAPYLFPEMLPLGVLAVCIKLNTRPHHGPVYLLHKAWAEPIVTFKVVGDLVAQPTR